MSFNSHICLCSRLVNLPNVRRPNIFQYTISKECIIITVLGITIVKPVSGERKILSAKTERASFKWTIRLREPFICFILI